jgi:hypothetical protein
MIPRSLFVLTIFSSHPVAHAEPAGPRECAARLLTRVFSPTLTDHGKVLTAKDLREWLLKQAKEGVRPKTIPGRLGKFLIYPTMGPLHLIAIATEIGVNRGKKELWRVPFEYLKKDGLTAVGYITTFQLLDGSPISAAEFYLLPKNENLSYLSETETPERTDGLRVYIDAVPEDNVLNGYGEIDFEGRFKKGSGVYIHPKNTRDMIEKLAELNKKTGKTIAQVEILGHGGPGVLELGKDILDQNKLNLLHEGPEVSFSKNAEIRFQSCFLGANLKCNLGKPGEDFIRGFGEKLLKNGGTVTASNRVIYVMNFSHEQSHYQTPWHETAMNLFLQPLEAVGIVATNAMIETREPWRRVEIPPSSDPAQIILHQKTQADSPKNLKIGL